MQSSRALMSAFSSQSNSVLLKYRLGAFCVITLMENVSSWPHIDYLSDMKIGKF